MIRKKLVMIILAGVMLIGAAAICHGADAAPPSGPPPDGKPGPPPTLDAAKLREDLQKSLDELMAEKVISSKEKTVILEYYDPFFVKVSGSDPRKMMETMTSLKKEKKDPLSLLVKDGKINQKQAEAIAKLFPPRPPQPRGGNAGPEPPPSFSGNEGMMPGPYPGMAMRNHFQPDPRPMPGPGGPHPRVNFRYKLDILVIAGVITESQADAILRKLHDDFRPGKKRDLPPDPEQDRVSPFEALTEEGILNREQAEVVGKVLLGPISRKMIDPEARL